MEIARGEHAKITPPFYAGMFRLHRLVASSKL